MEGLYKKNPHKTLLKNTEITEPRSDMHGIMKSLKRQSDYLGEDGDSEENEKVRVGKILG